MNRHTGPCKGTILVVDDEDAVRTVTAHLLQRYGFKVLTAADGQEGVDIFREHAKEISLVMLDMTMPGLNGDEAFVEIRNIRPDARVIMTSGHADCHAADKFAGNGFRGYLQKPYQAADLREKLTAAIGV